MQLVLVATVTLAAFMCRGTYPFVVPRTTGVRFNQIHSMRHWLPPPSASSSTVRRNLSDIANQQGKILTMSIDRVSEELKQHKADFDAKMTAATSTTEAEALRREYLGKKGPINQAMGYMRLLSNEEKPKLGAVVNEIKSAVEARVAERLEALERSSIEERMKSEYIDVTKPGISRMPDIGRRHPISMTMEKALDIFVG
jgi:hypothetical protein